MTIFRTVSLLFAIAALSLVGCAAPTSSDPGPTPPPPVQNWLSGYLSATLFDQTVTTYVDALDYEFGNSFIPLVDGSITAITVKIPDVHPGLKVTIWDKLTSAVIRTELIDITSSAVSVTKTVSPLALVKDKEYYITFNSNDWYSHKRTDSTVAVYPITVGDIKITGYAYKATALQELPNTAITNYYAGDLSFSFQK